MPDIANGYKWELYHITEDYSEYNDLAAGNSDKLKELQALLPDRSGEGAGLTPMDDSGYRALAGTEAERSCRTTGSTLHGQEHRHSCRQCSQHSGQGLHHHSQYYRSQRRCDGSDCEHGRPVGGYALLLGRKRDWWLK